jgi:acyl-coenzyme A thioesterase PaaI-like protein
LRHPGYRPFAVEFKVNLLAPAQGERFEARPTVLRRGRTLTVVRADVYAITYAITGLAEEMIATMLETTILRLPGDTPR